MKRAAPIRAADHDDSAEAPAQTSAPDYSGVTDFPMHYFAAIVRQNQLNLTHVLRPFELSVPQWRVLSALAAKDRHTVGQIAEFAVLDRSGLGRLLEQMEMAGLVERTSAPEDRRAVLIRLSPAGKKRRAAAFPLVVAHYRRLLRGISGAEYKALMGLLRRVKANALMMADVSLLESG
ncbi:MarR family winged helix-turn-helix transcriptional regulator [Rhodoplanes sp. Z2-YC6860]|uniref:MarR family winged helix-turn-helix transcriptional regulator n=1 Tax=Rhodoplanes sp. Z2-YC6860 TaxID=674703 RepID=UPI00078C218F|nr:MarR family transcriptional regulator [Rhodoplanes sp. Z2-YC6860]AMN38830.1 MarR family transcriptional regulator [Rhodoplanes sp. Z2-YC6860]